MNRGRDRRLERRENRLGGYIVSLIAGGLLLWVMNALPGWNVPYLLSSYSRALPAINLSLYVNVAMSIVLIFYHPRFFHHLGQAVMGGFSIYAISTLLKVFPVDFSSVPLPAASPSLNTIVRIAFLIAICGSAIGLLVHLVKFFALVFRGEVER